MVKDGQNLSTLFCKLNLSINDMRECKMKYFEVELTNPDVFLKQQTEDFVKANRWLLIKENETYNKFSTLQVTHFYLGLLRFAYTQAFLWISGSYSMFSD